MQYTVKTQEQICWCYTNAQCEESLRLLKQTGLIMILFMTE